MSTEMDNKILAEQYALEAYDFEYFAPSAKLKPQKSEQFLQALKNLREKKDIALYVVYYRQLTGGARAYYAYSTHGCEYSYVEG